MWQKGDEADGKVAGLAEVEEKQGRKPAPSDLVESFGVAMGVKQRFRSG